MTLDLTLKRLTQKYLLRIVADAADAAVKPIPVTAPPTPAPTLTQSFCTNLAVKLRAYEPQLAAAIQGLVEIEGMMADDLIWPKTLTPELAEALGIPNFRCGPLAGVYREAGAQINTRSEAEQAFILHKTALLALQHGPGWNTVFNAELRQVQVLTRERKAQQSEEASDASN